MKQKLLLFVTVLLAAVTTRAAKVTVNVAQEGTLEEVLNAQSVTNITELTITGRLTAKDIVYLRAGAGRVANLEVLDIKDVTLVESSEPYYSKDDITCYLSNEEHIEKKSKASSWFLDEDYYFYLYGMDLAYAFNGLLLTKVVLPSSQKKIGRCCFSGCKMLETVVMHVGVETIEACAFANSPALMDIDLSHVETINSSSLYGGTSYNSGAFKGCTGLSSVNLSNATFIGDGTFYGCGNLSSVNLSNATFIGNRAFYECGNITSVNLSNINTIGEYAFYGCGKLTSLMLSSQLKSIGESAFYATPITSITFPASIKTIGNKAFYQSSLKSIKFTKGSGGLYIGDCAFRDCSNLANVTFAEGLEEIGAGAFESNAMETIVLPNGLKTIGIEAFYCCRKLASVTLPNTIQTMGENAFAGTPWANAQTADSDGILYYGPIAVKYTVQNPNAGTVVRIKEGTTIIAGGFISSKPENITGVVLPSTLKTISAEAFANTAITSITLPESLELIGPWAFRNCTLLTKVTIPENVCELGGITKVRISLSPGYNSFDHPAFDGCSSITQVTLNAKNLTKDSKLGDLAGLAKLTIGSNVHVLPREFVTTSGDMRVVFEDRSEDSDLYFGYKALPYGNIKSLAIPNCRIALDDRAFENVKLNIEIPGIITELGRRAFYSSGVTGSIRLSEGITAIRENTFHGCEGLTSVNIPNSATAIEDDAFYGCTGLTSITIPNSVTTIGSAFIGCTGLTSVDIPNSVTSLDGTFKRCTGLTSVTMGNSVTTIGERTFYECEGLTTIAIPSSVTSIGKEAFFGCNGLTSVHISDLGAWCKIEMNTVSSYPTTANPLSYAHHLYLNGQEVSNVVIPNSVTAIGPYSFYGCTSLTSVVVPNSVKSIGASAFYGCSSMTTVSIGNSVDSIRAMAFEGCSGLTSVSIPSSVTMIGHNTFNGCTSLTSVTVDCGEELTMGQSAFYNCTNLSSVYITDLAAWCRVSFVDWASNPLYYAINLYVNSKRVSDLEIPNSVTSINSFSFFGANFLSSVTIPSSVTSIGENAFRYCYFQKVYSHIMEPFAISNDVFMDNQFSTATLYVPRGTKEKYTATDGWKDFQTIMEMEPENVEPGDLSGDGDVNATDLVMLVNKIMAEQFDSTADLNDDGLVNATDLVMLVNKIMGISTARRTTSYPSLPDCRLSIEPFNISRGETKELIISLEDSDVDLTAVQLDLCLPEGLSIVNERQHVDEKHHTLNASTVGNHTRMLLSSNTNDVITGTGNALVSVSLKADENFQGGDIVLTSQLLVTADAKEVKPTDIVFPLGSATSLDIVSVGKPADVYSLSGNRVRLNATSLQGLKKGVYVINGSKIIVK